MNADVDKFAQKVEVACEHVKQLYHQVNNSCLPQADLLAQSLEELSVTLEELHVAEEELLQRNEQLSAARQTTEAERQRYQELFDFAPDGYLVTNLEGTIIEANLAAGMLLNVPQRFLIGKPITLFVPEPARKSFRTEMARMRLIDRKQEWEIGLKPRERSPFEASLTVATIRDEAGQAIALRWLVRDITERKRAEEDLRRVQMQNLQLVEASRLKSEFLGILSHELRTPMNIILGFAQLLLRHSKSHLSAHQTQMVESILKSGKHLLALINDMLDYTKLETGRLDVHPELMHLSNLVTATVHSLEHLAHQKQLQLKVHINMEDPWVTNDSTRLRQILINLLSNAIKFTDVGEVEVEVQEIFPDRIAIAVKDTGIGIAESDQLHIFEAFHQVNSALTRNYEGTGLGLAITYSLVQKMRGMVTVESAPNQGSTFRVELPRQVDQGLRSGMTSLR